MPESVAIILGSGFGELIAGRPTIRPATGDYGAPSSELIELEIDGHAALGLARHGVPHSIPPHRVNYRANLAALAEADVASVIALNTVGVVTSVADPGGIAVPEQLIDYTWGREHTFVESVGEVTGHIDFTEPFSGPLRAGLVRAAEAAGVDCHDGGVYAATQGPRLETAAEIDRLERDGADFVGMTGMPEAVLAAEIGIGYACLALVVNRAAGRGEQPIHAELEAASAESRSKAIAVVSRFLADVDGAAS